MDSTLKVGKCYKLIGLNDWTTYIDDSCRYEKRSKFKIKIKDLFLVLKQQKFDDYIDRVTIYFLYQGNLLYTFVNENEIDKFEEIQ